MPHGGTAVFLADDLDVAKAALEERGVAFESHLGEVPGYARYASFADPDGNSMQLSSTSRRTALRWRGGSRSSARG